MEKSPREHHFYVAVAKYLFHHPEHGIVSVQDPIKIKDAEQYGLNPLILYGLTVARLPIRWMSFTPIGQPRAFRNVLLEAWSNAEGLRGRPDILLVNRHVTKACPELVRDMEKIKVQVEVADAKEKSLPASLRSAQNSSKWLMGRYSNKDRSLSGATQALCQDAQYDHDIHVRSGCQHRLSLSVFHRNKMSPEKRFRDYASSVSLLPSSWLISAGGWGVEPSRPAFRFSLIR